MESFLLVNNEANSRIDIHIKNKFPHTVHAELMECNISQNASQLETLRCYPPSSVSKVCFAVAILTMTIHCFFVTCIRSIRMLYGSFILTNLYMMMSSYIFFMTSCSMDIKTMQYQAISQILLFNWIHKRSIMESISQFSFLSSIYWNFAQSCQLCLVVYRGCHTSSTYKLFDCLQYFWGALIAFAMPGLCCYLKSFLDSWLNLNSKIVDSLRLEVECSFTKSISADLFFYIPIFLGMMITIVVLVAIYVMSCNKAREDRVILFQNQEVAARYGMCCKLVFTYLLIWMTGAAATYLISPSLWHVFTLCCSLQTLFIGVNFIFSRPVLDLLYRSRTTSDENFPIDLEALDMIK